jgi:hypothetical protein
VGQAAIQPPETDTRLITRLDAYPPCSLQVYKDRHRPIELMREFPKGD